jgi:GNAT superfamily N-acetyltransferase
MKQFELTIPFIYALFSGDAKLVYEEENIFLKGHEGISYSVTDKPKMSNYKGKKVCYFTYEQAMGHFLRNDKTKSHFVYVREDLLKLDNRKNNSLTCSEITTSENITELINYLSYNNLISVNEANKLKIILLQKEDYPQRWFVIRLNNNAQGYMLFVPNSVDIIGLAAHFCINKAIFNQLLNYALSQIKYPYINMLNMRFANLPYQEIPIFFGEYDNVNLSTLYNNLEKDEMLLKEIIPSGIYSDIEYSKDLKNVIVKCNNTYFASKNYVLTNDIECIKMHNDSEYKLFMQKSNQLLDNNLVEVDFKTFFSHVKNVPEYKDENYQLDLATTWGLGGHFYLYKDNGVVVGGGVVQYESIHYCYISYVFTAEKYRHKGYGRKIVKALTAIGYTETNKKMILIVINKDLIPFYISCGYEVTYGVDYQFGIEKKKHS